MSQSEFERNRESLATVRLGKPKKLSELSMRFWDEITSQQYHFDRAEVEVASLRAISKEELLKFFDLYIKHGAPHRRKLSIHVVAKGEGGAGNESPPDADALSSSVNGLPPPPPFVEVSFVQVL